MKVLGIDIGGSGVKGAIVNIKTGKLVSEKIRFSTPNPSKPKNIIKGIQSNIINESLRRFSLFGVPVDNPYPL